MGDRKTSVGRLVRRWPLWASLVILFASLLLAALASAQEGGNPTLYLPAVQANGAFDKGQPASPADFGDVDGDGDVDVVDIMLVAALWNTT